MATKVDFENPVTVAKALLFLYSRQTSVERVAHMTNEQNGVGFNSADAGFLTDVAEKTLIAGRKMSEGQYVVIKRIIRKYHSQLEAMDESSIVLHPAIADNPVKGRESNTAVKPQGDGRLFLDTDGKLAFLPYVYPSTQIKVLGFSGGKNDQGKFYWRANFSLDKANGVLRLFKNVEITPALQEKLDQLVGLGGISDQIAGLEFPFDFQKEGIQFLMKSPRSMLALSPGLGKSLTAIVAAHLSGSKRILVVAPKTLLRNWQREIQKWVHEDSVVWHKVIGEDSRWVVTNYETVSRKMVVKSGKESYSLADGIPQFDTVIVDESVMIKNRKALRTKAIGALTDKAKNVWLLSGSPITRFYDDMWSQLNVLDGKRFRSYWKFAERYCVLIDNGWGISIVNNRPDADKQLKSDLADIYFARTQDQVLDLPPFIFDNVEVEMDPAQYKAYSQMEQSMVALLDPNDTRVVAPIVLTQILRLVQLASNPALLTGKMALSPKWEAALEMLEYEELPAIIWTTFIETAKQMRGFAEKAGHRVAVLSGDTPDQERQEIVDAFQNGELDVLIAHPAVGKFGLTLTRARTSIYLERSYNADDYHQSLYRVRRIGTEKSPHIVHLISARPNNDGTNTVDHVIDKILKFRKDSSAALTAGELLAAWNFPK